MRNHQQTPIIVTFMGTVGAGKSTQITAMKYFFDINGKKTVKTYLRSNHGTTYLLSLFFNFLDKVSDNKVPTSVEFRRKIQSLWNFSESISILFKFLFSVYIPYTLGYNVIIEEGIKMSRENFTHFRPQLLGVPSTLPVVVRLLERWMDVSSHFIFIIDARDDVLNERRKSRSFRRSESQVFVEMQRRAFSSIQGNNVYMIDTTNKSILDVHKEIINHIRND